MKLIIPKDLDFKYENETAVNDILTLANKYNWSPEEKIALGEIVGKMRRAGYVKCYNYLMSQITKKGLIDDIERLTKDFHGK